MTEMMMSLESVSSQQGPNNGTVRDDDYRKRILASKTINLVKKKSKYRICGEYSTVPNSSHFLFSFISLHPLQ